MSEGDTNKPAAGLSVTDPTADVPPRITGPLPCVQCLYDLSGLGHDQKCSECGTEAARTLNSSAAASDAELKRLRRGLMFIAGPMIGGTLWLLAAQFSIMWFAFAMGPGVAGTALATILYIIPFVSAGFCLMSAFGWSKAMKSTAMFVPGRTKRARTIARLAWWYAILMSLMLIGSILPDAVGFGGMEFAAVGMALSAATLLLWLVRTSLGFGLLAHVATGCCAPRTAMFMTIIRWVAVGLTVAVAGLATMGEFLPYDLSIVLPMEFLLSIAALGLAAAIIMLGASAALLRRRVAPFAREAGKRKLNELVC